MIRPRDDPRLALVYRDNLNALLRRVLVIALGLGFPAIVVVTVLRAPTDPLVAWGFPPLALYLACYTWVLVRRPQHTVSFSRGTLVAIEILWVLGMLHRLWSAEDVHDGWGMLFPTSFMGMVVFLVVGFLVFGTRQALVNAAVVIGAVLAAGLTALLRLEGGDEHVLDLVRYVVYLTVVSLLLHVLSRAKARLALAVAEARQASAEARQLRDIAYLDPLTAIANRRRLVEELTFQAGRVGDTWPVAVVYLDLDQFKAVNDAHGHGVGDEVLCQVADIAARLVRQDDLVARLGGEEFVVVAPGTGRDRALQLAERLRAALPEQIGARVGIPVTASFGVVMLGPGEHASAVLDRVDRLMYDAKSAGRDRIASAV